MGGYFTKWLLQGGKHTVTALTRQDSQAQFPAGVHVARYTPDDPASLERALHNQQFLVITLPSGGISADAAAQAHALHLALVRAAAAAGVPYVMPNAYGPDPLNEAMMRQVLIGDAFGQVKAEVERLGVSKWVVLATGFWYEWSLVGDGAHRFGCDFAARTMTFFDDGAEKITTTTWDQCGRALAAYLSLPMLPHDDDDDKAKADASSTSTPTVDTWANRAIYIKSFRVSQQDLFASAQRVTGTTAADWSVTHVASQARVAAAQHKLQTPATQFEGFSELLYTRIFFPTGEGDHARRGLANAALGLPEEDMDAATEEGLRLVQTGVLVY